MNLWIYVSSFKFHGTRFMPLTKKQKEDVVENISSKLLHNAVFVFTHFSKVSVEKIRDLRKNLKAKNVEYKIIKKSLLQAALKKASISIDGIDFKSSQGALGVAFSKDDQLNPAKITYLFSKAKDNELFKVLGGMFHKEILGVEKIALLAKVNSREDVLAGLLRQLKAPVSKLVYVLQAIADRKQTTNN